MSSAFGPRAWHLRPRCTPTPAGGGHDLLQAWQSHQRGRHIWWDSGAHRWLWIHTGRWPTLHGRRRETHRLHATRGAGCSRRLDRLASACTSTAAEAPISGVASAACRALRCAGAVQPLCTPSSTSRSSSPASTAWPLASTASRRSSPGPQGVQARLTSPASISGVVSIATTTTIVPSPLTLRSSPWHAPCW